MSIQIAGTSGSGKTYVVRQLMEQSSRVDAYFVIGRQFPMGYYVNFPSIERSIYLLGSYENPTGGCDTIKSVKDIYSTVEHQNSQGVHVVFEGLFAMNQTRGPALASRLPSGAITVLLLTTPIATCFSSIDERRAEKGLEGLPVSRHGNTKGNYVRARNYTSRMRDAGARVKRVSRKDALPCLLELLTTDE